MNMSLPRWLIIVIVSILLLIGGFFALNSYIYNEKQGNTMDNTNTTTSNQDVHITPISHATMVLTMGEHVLYTDPVGGAKAFTGQPTPTVVLVTDIHGDHFDPETLSAISKEETVVVVPAAVADMLSKDILGTVVVLHNGEKTTQKGVEIEAIPMYNIPESASAFHTKGRGNGYVITAGKRVYIAGDTSATPEMRALKNIDIAFVPMNLPYTMSVEEAADGVVAFAPKVVHPYHYRGPDGLADIDKFKELVEAKNSNIHIELLNFYPESK